MCPHQCYHRIFQGLSVNFGVDDGTLSVQSMLYDAFYRSIRDAFNGIPLKPSNAHFVGIAFTFMGSAFLHAYPLLIVHAAWRDIVCMCLFFFFSNTVSIC